MRRWEKKGEEEAKLVAVNIISISAMTKYNAKLAIPPSPPRAPPLNPPSPALPLLLKTNFTRILWEESKFSKKIFRTKSSPNLQYNLQYNHRTYIQTIFDITTVHTYKQSLIQSPHTHTNYLHVQKIHKHAHAILLSLISHHNEMKKRRLGLTAAWWANTKKKKLSIRVFVLSFFRVRKACRRACSASRWARSACSMCF